MIFRSEHDEGYTLINNDIIADERLSPGAFYLLVYMLSCADSWQFSIKGLAYCLNLSERTISDRLTELKKAGYVEVRRITNEKGKILGCEWDVFEVPKTMSQKNHNVAKPQRGKTTTWKNHNVEKPQRGFTASITNTNITNTNITNTKGNKEEGKTPLGEFQNVFLSTSEIEKLQTKLGDKLNAYIEDLGDYLKTHPKKKYASHYRTILKWYERDQARNKAPETDDTLVDDLMEMARKKGLV